MQYDLVLITRDGYVFLAGDSELQELRLMKEEVMSEMAAMREMKSELEGMMDEVGDQLAAVQEMLENIQNGTINTPSQEPGKVVPT